MEPESIKYEIIRAKDGNPVILVESGSKKIPLHSRISPLREGDAYGEKYNPEKYDTLIVLGTGLGYHLLPLRDIIGRYRLVILIDRIRDIEKELSDNPLTSFLTESENCLLFGGKSPGELSGKLGELIDLERIKGLSVVEHPPSVRIFGEYYDKIKEEINRILNRQAGSLSARKAFGRLYLTNIIKNLKEIRSCRGVSSLINRGRAVFSGHSALVITPGPSLDIFLPEIERYAGHFFLIAVDSALSPLLRRGIRPDFAVSIDPQPYINEHFSGIELGDILPVFSLSAHHTLVKKYGGYLSLNTHPVSQLIEELFPGRIGTVDSRTGSVAGDAVMLALKAGFREIGLIGFDFSFPRFTIYARGTAYQRRYGEYFQNRILNSETSNFNYIMKSSGGFRSGGKFTRRSFIQYRESLEKLISEQGRGSIHNINGTGLPLEGSKNTGFADFVRRASRERIEKTEILKEIITGEPGGGIDMGTLTGTFLAPEIFKKIYESSITDPSDGKRMEKTRLLAEKIFE